MIGVKWTSFYCENKYEFTLVEKILNDNGIKRVSGFSEKIALNGGVISVYHNQYAGTGFYALEKKEHNEAKINTKKLIRKYKCQKIDIS